jgi:tetratricopeptide (TPR) repeat protein
MRILMVLAAGMLFLAGCGKPLPPEEAERRWSDLQRHFESEDYRYVVKKGKKLGKKRSERSGDAYFLSGEAAYRLGWYPRAFDLYELCAKKRPFSDYIVRLADREYAMAYEAIDAGSDYVRKRKRGFGRKVPVTRVLEQAVTHKPFGEKADRAYFDIGHIHMKREAWEEAGEAFRTLMEQYPGSSWFPEALLRRVEALLGQTRSPEYNQVHVDSARELMKSYHFRLEDPEQRRRARELALALDRISARYEYGVAAFYRRRGRESAERWYLRSVVANFPDTEEAGKAAVRLERGGSVDKLR